MLINIFDRYLLSCTVGDQESADKLTIQIVIEDYAAIKSRKIKFYIMYFLRFLMIIKILFWINFSNYNYLIYNCQVIILFLQTFLKSITKYRYNTVISNKLINNINEWGDEYFLSCPWCQIITVQLRILRRHEICTKYKW